MGKRNIEELKEIYKAEWEKACRKFQSEPARRKAFLAFVEMKKAKVQDYVEREKERRRRTRALILFSSSLIRKLDSEELKQLLELTRSELFAKEGKQTVDYLPFLIEEIEAVKEDFEFEIEEPETEPEEEAVADKKEKIREKLEKQFEEVAEKLAENLAENLEKRFPGFTREKR